MPETVAAHLSRSGRGDTRGVGVRNGALFWRAERRDRVTTCFDCLQQLVPVISQVSGIETGSDQGWVY